MKHPTFVPLALVFSLLVPFTGRGAEPAEARETQVQYLSGRGADDAVLWDFYCTAGRKSGVWSKIHVPSCWEQEGFGTYQYGVVLRSRNAPPLATEQGKYRLTFDVPADWKGGVVRLVFQGSMTDTEVRINGQPAGPLHQGAFYEFKYDVTGLLNYGGANLLEATVSKESANKSVNDAERRGDYWNFGGIFRPVLLEAMPAQFVDRVAIDARADGSFVADAFVGGGAAGTVTAQILSANGHAIGAPFSAAVEAGKATVRTTFANPALWTAETPQLYGVRFTLDAGGGARHTVAERFGFRTFEVRPRDGLYLNGQKITMRGVNRHSFWPESARTLSRRMNIDDVQLMKEMNMNAVRMSHYPPDRDFLDACDELGLYVLDELGGWHGHYDTAIGRQLVGEMVRRDVNHPSILFWDNGNEGGWNTELDGEFAKWDPRQRPVLHPQQKLSEVETMHYRSYAETQEYLSRGDIYLPTEFLHGLYDGGHGAGLWDYWELMRKTPNCAGGFLWVFADEGVVRTDENGRIDNVTNFGADGILGPHHEREGSFNTVRQVWSPVQITTPEKLPDDFSGTLAVENRYDFTSLNQCTFRWMLSRFPAPDDSRVVRGIVATGETRGPAIAPHAVGELKLPLPAGWRDADVLYVAASDPSGAELWRWGWSWKKSTDFLATAAGTPAAKAELAEGPGELVARTGALAGHFNKATGELAGVMCDGKPLNFNNGPRLVALRRGDRRADGTLEAKFPKGTDRRYDNVATHGKLTALASRLDGADAIVEANYDGDLRLARWRISADGTVRLDYEYAFADFVDLIGVNFDYPETAMKSIRWLGRGPYRVWQNRLEGTTLDVWSSAYNDPLPGESFVYPEFKGYFRDLRWAKFNTSEGTVLVGNDSPGSYLGVYSPRDGRDALLYNFPPAGIAILDVIPPVRNKVNTTDLIGPQSQPRRVSGVQHGAVRFRFTAHSP